MLWASINWPGSKLFDKKSGQLKYNHILPITYPDRPERCYWYLDNIEDGVITVTSEKNERIFEKFLDVLKVCAPAINGINIKIVELPPGWEVDFIHYYRVRKTNGKSRWDKDYQEKIIEHRKKVDKKDPDSFVIESAQYHQFMSLFDNKEDNNYFFNKFNQNFQTSKEFVCLLENNEETYEFVATHNIINMCLPSNHFYYRDDYRVFYQFQCDTNELIQYKLILDTPIVSVDSKQLMAAQSAYNRTKIWLEEQNKQVKKNIRSLDFINER